ncbi:MAG: UDP binding domain-containing protein, partial [Pseudomonadota bacterium]
GDTLLHITSRVISRKSVEHAHKDIVLKYLMPGFAFGGSCLPKDLRALNHIARHRDLELPLLDSMLPSNQHLIDRTAQRIQKHGKRKIGLLGLSFKRNTDDLRESPFVTLAEQLIGKGFDLKAFDKNVSVSKLIGSNQAYVEQHLPHIDSVLSETLEEVAKHAEVLVVCNFEPEYEACLTNYHGEKVIVDLARLPDALRSRENYDGLAW